MNLLCSPEVYAFHASVFGIMSWSGDATRCTDSARIFLCAVCRRRRLSGMAEVRLASIVVLGEC